MAEDLYSAILNSAARNAARQEMDTTALDRLAMEQQLARILAGQRRRERRAEIWPGGTFTLVEPEKRPSNALYEVLSNARLNRGLENLAGNAAEVIFGEPTGNAVIDYGVSNIPGVGAVAIGAGGGQPGLVDILGGIGAPLKGMAVVAKPLASRIIRNASYTTGQDLGMDAARNVARNVIDRMARIQGDVTGDEIYPFIKVEMQNLGLVGARDEARIKELATGFAEDTYLRALEDLEAGKTPRLNLVLPDKENIAYKPLYEGIDEGVSLEDKIRASERDAMSRYNSKIEEAMQNLSEEERDEIMRKSYERAIQAKAEGKYGRANVDNIARQIARYETGLLMTAKKKAAEGPKEVVDNTINMADDVKSVLARAQREAYAKAKEEALAQGYNVKQATHIAMLARNRARRAALKEIGGDALEATRTSSKQAHANIAAAREKLHPSIKEDIEAEANRYREEVRAKSLAAGESSIIAAKKAGNAYKGKVQSMTREILKELGFKNANDPRLQNYEVIGRTPEESVMKAVADDIFGK